MTKNLPIYFITALLAVSINLTAQCPGFLGTGFTTIASIPYTDIGHNTVGDVDDITSANCAAECNGSYLGGNDYVYIYTPNVTQTYQIILSNQSSIWGGFQVFSGCPDTAPCIGGGYTSSATDVANLMLTSGTTYYIVCDIFATPVSYSYDLSIAVAPAPPANDNCSGAVALTVNSTNTCTVTTLGNTSNATQSLAACVGSGADDDIWYKFTATSSIVSIELTTVSGLSDRVHQVFSGTSCASLTSIKCSDPETSTTSGLTVGVEYFVRVHSYATSGFSEFNICLKTPPPPPANDDCAGAITLPLSASSACGNLVSGTTLSATPSTEADCSTTHNDVWYKFTPPTTGAYNFSVVETFDGGSSSTYVSVFSGACGGLTQVGTLCTSTSIPNLNLTGSTTYYVNVRSTSTTSYVNFDLCVFQTPPPPANDDCAGAIILPLSASVACGSAISGTTLSATASTEADCSTTHKDVWYKIAPPTTGGYNFSVVETFDGGSSSTYVSVFSGACGSLAQVGTLCTSTSLSDLSLTAGTTYYVNVRSTSTTSYVNFNLCVYASPPPPANDDPGAAVTLSVGSVCNFLPYTNTSATGTVGPPAPGCGSYLGGDVWFKAQVPASGKLIVDTNTGVMLDSGMAFYSSSDNTSNGTFSLIECDDDDSVNGAMSMITRTGLVPGDIIFVRVWEYGNNNNGTFSICAFDDTTPPTNNVCSGAVLLANQTPGQLIGVDLIGATASNAVDGGCAFDGLADLFYKIVTDGNGGDLTVTVTPTGMNVALYAYADCSMSSVLACANTGGIGAIETLNLTGLNFQDPRGSGNRTQDVFIRVDASGGGTFDIGTAGSALPIILKNIEAYEDGDANMIAWSTSSEINADKILVEKSKDGSKWETLGVKSAIGLSTGGDYSLEDQRPFKTSYYRLKMMDLDGSYEYSRAVTVRRSSERFTINGVYPNPTSNNFTIDMTSDIDGTSTFSITDLVGRTVMTQSKNISYGRNQLEIDVTNLPNGTYIISFPDTLGNKFIQKITKI